MKKQITFYFWSNSGKVTETVTMENFIDLPSAYNYCDNLMKQHRLYNGKSQVFIKEVN